MGKKKHGHTHSPAQTPGPRGNGTPPHPPPTPLTVGRPRHSIPASQDDGASSRGGPSRGETPLMAPLLSDVHSDGHSMGSVLDAPLLDGVMGDAALGAEGCAETKLKEMVNRRSAEVTRLRRELEGCRKRIARLQTLADDAVERAENADATMQAQNDEIAELKLQLAGAGWGRGEGACLGAKDVYKDVADAADRPAVRARWQAKLSEKLRTTFDVDGVAELSTEVLQRRLQHDYEQIMQLTARSLGAAQQFATKHGEATSAHPEPSMKSPHVQPRQPSTNFSVQVMQRAGTGAGAGRRASPVGGTAMTPPLPRGAAGRISALPGDTSDDEDDRRPQAVELSFDEEVCRRHAAAEGVFVVLIEALQSKLAHIASTDGAALAQDPLQTVRVILEEEVAKLRHEFVERERRIAERWWAHAKREHEAREDVAKKYASLHGHSKMLEGKLAELRVVTNALVHHNKQLLGELTAAQLRGVKTGGAARQCTSCNARMLFTEVASSFTHGKTLAHILPNPPAPGGAAPPPRTAPTAGSVSPKASSNPPLGSFLHMETARVLKRAEP
eukprot:TRINITY_DN271_c0_g2_i2.p1 TRINITY_DN271_c0_g2~~TRINITY_DN271_c0_g2_i2.p1  ORF type:complete len:558 (+),score=137.65 TRINITY_DN271_c0_g2_i2:828-2501(+)